MKGIDYIPMNEEHKIDVRHSTIDRTLEVLNELGIEVSEVEEFPKGVNRNYDYKTNIHVKDCCTICIDFEDKEHILPTYRFKIHRPDFDLFQQKQTFQRLEELKIFMQQNKRELLIQ